MYWAAASRARLLARALARLVGALLLDGGEAEGVGAQDGAHRLPPVLGLRVGLAAGTDLDAAQQRSCDLLVPLRVVAEPLAQGHIRGEGGEVPDRLDEVRDGARGQRRPQRRLGEQVGGDVGGKALGQGG